MFDEFRPEPIAIQIVGDDDAESENGIEACSIIAGSVRAIPVGIVGRWLNELAKLWIADQGCRFSVEGLALFVHALESGLDLLVVRVAVERPFQSADIASHFLDASSDIGYAGFVSLQGFAFLIAEVVEFHQVVGVLPDDFPGVAIGANEQGGLSSKNEAILDHYGRSITF